MSPDGVWITMCGEWMKAQIIDLFYGMCGPEYPLHTSTCIPSSDTTSPGHSFPNSPFNARRSSMVL
jgi:hypothetical protein